MTGPAMNPPAQGGWRQMGGGYPMPGEAQQQQAQPVQQQNPYAGVPQQFQQPQQPTFGLPPQMAGGFSPDGPGSPLQNLPPVGFPQQQQNQPRQQPVQQQQQQQAAPQGYPQQQFQQPPVQQPTVDLNARVSGPNVPPELQGRTVGEVLQLTSGLRNVTLDLMRRAEQQPVPQPSNSPSQGQGAQAAPQPGQAQAPAWDWRNPAPQMQQVAEAAMEKVVNERIMPMLAPMTAQSNMTAIQQAEQSAAAEFGQDWATLRPAIYQALQGADPRMLMQSNVWRTAAATVYGNQALQARRNGQQPMFQNQNAPGAYPAQQVSAGSNPVPNLNGFFSEAPTQSAPVQGAPQLSPLQQHVMQQMAANGIPAEHYLAMLGGGR